MEKKKLKIKIIRDKCISAATCVVHAPNTYALDDDGIAYVKEGEWDEAEKIIAGAKSCPTMAVIVEDMEGNQLWPKL
ncbi:ferredoxin [Patescibacteria group bacterium]